MKIAAVRIAASLALALVFATDAFGWGADGHSIVAEIERLREQLSYGNDDARREALRFAVHFIGDLHQPLHTVAEEIGGNGIRVDYEVRGLRCPRCVPKRTQDNLHVAGSGFARGAAQER